MSAWDVFFRGVVNVANVFERPLKSGEFDGGDSIGKGG